MTDLENRIDNLELRASESKLIADLALDPEVSVYNTALARKLKAEADRLKRMRVAQVECHADPASFQTNANFL